MVDNALALLKVIHKIPMFHGLDSDYTRMVLQSCEFRGMRRGEAICQFNDQSDEMYILLSGRLRVYNENQLLLASIDPVAPVGEMGLITGQPRSATVSSLSDSNLLVLRKVAFDRLLRSNAQLCIQVYRSVIGAMGQRLAESRTERHRVSQHRNELEQKLSEVEDQVVAMSNGEGR